MPKRKRTEKEGVKLLAAAGKATGQKTITQSMFGQFSSSKTPVVEDNAELETESQVNSDDCRVCSVANISYEQDQHENSSLHQAAETTSTSSSTSGFEEDVWVRNKTDFTETDKINSEIDGKKGRYCQGDWLQLYSWSLYNRNKRAIFCEVCTNYAKGQNIEANTSVFIYNDDTKSVGFQNWKKGSDKLKDHDESGMHMAAVAERIRKEIKQVPDVTSQLSKQAKNQQQLRRQGLVAHLNTLKTLLRQGIAIRGDKDIDSNIIQFNLDKSLTEPGLKLLLEDGKYLSHDILEQWFPTFFVQGPIIYFWRAWGATK